VPQYRLFVYPVNDSFFLPYLHCTITEHMFQVLPVFILQAFCAKLIGKMIHRKEGEYIYETDICTSRRP
jgi:hypothetical protein